MPVFMVERDLAGATVEDVEAAQRAAIEKSREFTSRGRPVRYIRSTFLPGESVCMCLFEAPDPEVVREVNEAASLPFSQVKPALDLTP